MTSQGAGVLAPLMDLPDVREASDKARTRVDELLWNRALASKAQDLAKATSVRCAQGSAAIEGIDVAVAAWSSGDAFDDSPLGHAAAGIWRMEKDLRTLLPIWSTAPTQALARMHSLLARDILPEDQLGRPRSENEADDPLRLKALPDASSVKLRLGAMSKFASSEPEVPAVVEAAIVHGEILALRPFAWGSGPVARASFRLVLAHRGLDPDLLVMSDAAINSHGRNAYVSAVRDYLSATPEGVAKWIKFCCEATAVGARMSNEELGNL